MGWTQQSPKQPVPPASLSTDVAITFASERSQVVPSICCFWFKGGGADGAVTFWKGLGLAASLTGDRASNVEPGVDVNKINFLVGPRFTWRTRIGANHHGMSIFGQGLFGEAHSFDGFFPSSNGNTTRANSLDIQVGGGLNYYLTKKFGLRLIEADIVRSEFPNATSNTQTDMRLGFGITYHIQADAVQPLSLVCSASPAVVFPGDPVTVTATASNLIPKLNPIYSWAGTGVTGLGSMATVATAALAPGTYTVKSVVQEGKHGKERFKPWETAAASTSFTVKQFDPPSVSCSASPTTIKPGENSTVIATGISPQNRPLTYSYSASVGAVNGNGTTATFNSVGAPSGELSITCTTTDDKGQTAFSNTNLIVASPVALPIPHTQELCSITFSKDRQRPTRVDNEAKACLDEVALKLQKTSDSRVILVGNSDAKEKVRIAEEVKLAAHSKQVKVEDKAAERAVNTKEYLVAEKGIDASRISVATSAADRRSVENYIVPTGANFSDDVAGTTTVDESTVMVQSRKSLPVQQAH
jgi:hypothetical protein